MGQRASLWPLVPAQGGRQARRGRVGARRASQLSAGPPGAGGYWDVGLRISSARGSTLTSVKLGNTRLGAPSAEPWGSLEAM